MTSSSQRLDHCLNCQRPLPGREVFCPDCGQKNLNRKQPFWQFLFTYLTEQTQLNSRFFRTIRTFLAQPGLLTLEYWRGKRVAYLKPVRLFLILGVTAFLLFNWALDFHPEGQGLIKFTVNEEDLQNVETVWGRHLLESMREAQQAPQAFLAKVLDRIPLTLLVLLPLFAWVLRLFYRKQSPYLVEHLVFLLHLHVFVFIEISLLSLLSFINLYDQYLVFFAAGVAWIFSLLSAKRVYGENWPKTLLKFGFLSVIYFLSMPTLTFLVSMFVSLFR